MLRVVIGTGLLTAAFLAATHRGPRPLTAAERRRLDELLPVVRARVEELRARLARLGIDTFVGQTFRSQAEQEEGFEEGRTATLRSWHRVRRAVDLPIVDRRGRRVPLAGNEHLYATLQREAEALGFRHLGLGPICRSDGVCFRDPWHLEYRQGLTWAQAAREVSA